MYDELKPYYLPQTWAAVTGRLEAMDDAEIKALAKSAGIDTTGPREELVADLLVAGGFLLVHLGLIDQPEMVAGTIYLHDDEECLLDQTAAEQLARRDDVTVRDLDGDEVGTMSVNEVIYDLETSDDFEQVSADQLDQPQA